MSEPGACPECGQPIAEDEQDSAVCPNCGGAAIELTDAGDDAHQLLCIGIPDEDAAFRAGGCGHRWTVPFTEPDEQPGP